MINNCNKNVDKASMVHGVIGEYWPVSEPSQGSDAKHCLKSTRYFYLS